MYVCVGSYMLGEVGGKDFSLKKIIIVFFCTKSIKNNEAKSSQIQICSSLKR